MGNDFWKNQSLATKARLTAATTAGLIAIGVTACSGTSESTEGDEGGSETSTTSTSASADPAPTQQVEMPGGGIADLSVVSEGDPIALDSTDLANQPPAADKPCGYLVEWEDLYECMKDDPDYVRGINRNAPDAGFDWAGVARMATVDLDTRYIVVVGWSQAEKPESVARAEMRALLPDLREDVPVVYRECIVNTRYKDLQPFWHCQQQVRVNLAPLVFNDKGEVIGYRNDAGVFVDCYNENWLAKPVVFTPPPVTSIPPFSTPPTTTPPTTSPPPTTTPPTTTPPTTSPPPTTTTPGKDSCQIVGQPCAEGDGGTIIYGPEQSRPEKPAPWKTQGPPRVTQEPEYTPAPQPSPEPVPDSTPVPSAQQTPPPPPATGAVPEDDAADDYVPPPGM